MFCKGTDSVDPISANQCPRLFKNSSIARISEEEDLKDLDLHR